MNAFFYPRLALSGMRRDRRIYAPYLAACVFMTAVVYDLAFLADSPALYAVGSGVNGMGTSAIRLVMTLGKWVMAVFALLFFFYTNAFLIRRRKKELGLMRKARELKEIREERNHKEDDDNFMAYTAVRNPINRKRYGGSELCGNQ